MHVCCANVLYFGKKQKRMKLTWVYVIQQQGSTWSNQNSSNHRFLSTHNRIPTPAILEKYKKLSFIFIYIYNFWLDKDHLVGVEPPVLKFLFEERSTDVRWVVQLPRPVVVQDLCKYPRMPFKDVNLIRYVSKSMIYWIDNRYIHISEWYHQRVTFCRFLGFEYGTSDTITIMYYMLKSAINSSF